jgi:hypothetical protein
MIIGEARFPITEIVDLILRQKTVAAQQTTLLAFDGPSGVGKTTTCQHVAEMLTRAGKSVVVISLDHFLVARPKHEALKKYILGERLSQQEQDLLSEADKGLVTPRQRCSHERELFWRTEEIGQLLTSMRAWATAGTPYDYAYSAQNLWDRETGQLSLLTTEVRHGDIVLMEGKLSLWKSFVAAAQYDLTFRLIDFPSTIFHRYAERKYLLTVGDEATRLAETTRAKRFYKLLMWPSWEAYGSGTASHVDWTIHLGRRTLMQRAP